MIIIQNLSLIRTDVPIYEVHHDGAIIRVPGVYGCVLCKTVVSPDMGMFTHPAGWSAHITCIAVYKRRRQI
jgi:hypothetical protein